MSTQQQNGLTVQFFLQNVLADELSTVLSSCRSTRKLIYFVVEVSSKLWKFFVTYDQLAATANTSLELAPPLWHGSFSLTATDTL